MTDNPNEAPDFDEDKNWEEEIEQAKAEALAEEKTKAAAEPIIPIFELKETDKGFDEPDPTLIIPPTIEPPKTIEKEKYIADLSGSIFITSGDLNALTKALSTIEVTPDTAEKLLENPEGKLIELTVAATIASPRTKYQYEELKNKHTNLIPIETILGPDGKTTLADKTTKGATFTGVKNVTGQAAILNTMSRLNPFRKVFLPHSGFYIVLRDLEALEIKNILDSVDEEHRELGRSLGGYYYLLDDIFFIQKTAEILKASVVDSNLPDWNEDNRLLQAITILDHDTILGAHCASMYKNGVKYKFLCPELSCPYTETILTDFNALKRVDYTRLPKEALDILFSPEPFTKERFLQYQELIGAKRIIPVDDSRELHMKVPSIFTFIKFGSVIISAILKYLYSGESKRPKEAQLKDLRSIFYYKNFISWVEKLVFLNEEADEKGSFLDFETSEPEAIDKVLESNIWEENPNREKLLGFFSDVRLVHFAYLGKTCPSCGKTPNPETNGLIPIDVSDFFFQPVSISPQKRKRITQEFEAKLPKFLESTKDIKNSTLKSIAYETFMNSLISKQPSTKMYDFYTKQPSPSDYTSVYFQECVWLMIRFPDIHEKLGLSLEQLLKMSPATISMLEDQMVTLYNKKKTIKQNGIKDADYATELLRHRKKKSRR